MGVGVPAKVNDSDSYVICAILLTRKNAKASVNLNFLVYDVKKFVTPIWNMKIIIRFAIPCAIPVDNATHVTVMEHVIMANVYAIRIGSQRVDWIVYKNAPVHHRVLVTDRVNCTATQPVVCAKKGGMESIVAFHVQEF